MILILLNLSLVNHLILINRLVSLVRINGFWLSVKTSFLLLLQRVQHFQTFLHFSNRLRNFIRILSQRDAIRIKFQSKILQLGNSKISGLTKLGTLLRMLLPILLLFWDKNFLNQTKSSSWQFLKVISDSKFLDHTILQCLLISVSPFWYFSYREDLFMTLNWFEFSFWLKSDDFWLRNGWLEIGRIQTFGSKLVKMLSQIKTAGKV